jgi:uncharacterized DUF497 family protein
MADDVIYQNKYIWSAGKNELNRVKHHISFETATLVFDDPFLVEEFDSDNSFAEDRFNVTGSAVGLINNVLFTVSVTYKEGLIRIISARDADILEIGDYYEQFKQYFERTDEN